MSWSVTTSSLSTLTKKPLDQANSIRKESYVPSTQIEQLRYTGCLPFSIFNLFIRPASSPTETEYNNEINEKSYEEYLNPKFEVYENWHNFSKALKDDPFYVNRCLSKLWKNDENFLFPPYKHVVDIIITELSSMTELQGKDNAKIKKGLIDLQTIQNERRFGFTDVNNTIADLLSLNKNMVTEANSHAQLALDNTKYTIKDLFHFRIFCVDNLEFSDLDNPGLVSLVGVAFLPFKFDGFTTQDFATNNDIDSPLKKSLHFASEFAKHDISHSDIIELRIVRSLDSNRKTNIKDAIMPFIESRRNYYTITQYIDNMENGIEKRALEFIKFNMGHEDVQAPNFWSNHSLEIFRHLCDRYQLLTHSPLTITTITERLLNKFAYPEQYLGVRMHTRKALSKIFEILDVKENYSSHSEKIDRFF